MHFAPRITFLDREDSPAASYFDIVAMRSDAEDLKPRGTGGAERQRKQYALITTSTASTDNPPLLPFGPT